MGRVEVWGVDRLLICHPIWPYCHTAGIPLFAMLIMSQQSMDYRDYDKADRRRLDEELVPRKRRAEETEEQEEGLRPGDPG